MVPAILQPPQTACDRSRADLKYIASRLPVTQTALSMFEVDVWSREVLNCRDAIISPN